MPIYEYKCDDCGRHYEQLRRMSDADAGLECPDCRSARVNRQLSSFATHSSTSSRTQLPMAGCGKQNCCMMNGQGCQN
jgi:putative FmdB family regulatory protein